MYTCPECGRHNVRIEHMVPMIEYWYGDDVETEEDLAYERDPEQGSITCLECGCEGDYIEEWLDV